MPRSLTTGSNYLKGLYAGSAAAVVAVVFALGGPGSAFAGDIGGDGDGEGGHTWRWKDAFGECDSVCDPIKSACPCVTKPAED
jgi:hypothetical protein